MLKLPKPDILTSLPETRVPWMMSKKASTMSLDSRLFRPRRSNSSSASSALVRVGVSRLGRTTRGGFSLLVIASPPQPHVEPAAQIGQHLGNDRFDALVGQRVLVVE